MDKKYFVEVENQLVEVNVEVYRFLQKSKRRERYLIERDIKKGVVSYHEQDTRMALGDRIMGEETIADKNAISPEEFATDSLMVEKLQKCILLLAKDEQELLNYLFFKQLSERQLSKILGVPRMTINNRKLKICEKLTKLMEN